MLGTKISLKYSVLIPILGFTLSSYSMVNFVFYSQYIDYSKVVDFILIGAPFIGRALTPITYGILVSRVGISRILYSSLGSMGLIDLFEYYTYDFDTLLVLRIIIGILFGLSTSASVELATESKSNIIVGMTMGGWALGWVLAATTAFILEQRMLLASVVLIVIALPLLLKSSNLQTFIGGNKMNLAFSAEALLIFLLGFEPAYILQVVPSLLGDGLSIQISLIAYLISFAFYILFSILKDKIKTLIISSLIVGILGFLSFFLLIPWIFIPFTALGLGTNAILPIIAKMTGIEPRRIGPSMNLASLSGFIIPVGVELGNVLYNSAVLTLITSIMLVTFVYLRTRASRY
ncbi:transporter [Sulfolobus sp. A20]|uniref:transporter n=1 Tax=Saccharolobus sp. A20 TaxID=1891280 RepID=UPI000845E889|nr:transporter [Sulfolobus sp. A20]TRM75349.1 transporter [Sulfolobus sp. A20-N-F8]TRM81312.1 transporter [Sulfolobus sp. D5]TRM83380.1 transporter [Sulfolobus sp. A20-N-F6]TRM84704.1 transporter [Sulfolobus sp. F3]TRM87322.1 transporter [Sulfolobus sp. C3]TRM88699.1 transporter [Sulfolobus sp. E3]TRM93050.1 transporter [Sulfolobus sp. A20-N-G8]TRN00771.1 transporter [Sulfolobus sp. E1]TRN01819.1 transporter [Sulfolobus sp. F1]